MIKRARNYIFKAIQISGIAPLVKTQKKGAVALLYHGVEKHIVDPRVQILHIPFKRFEKQIEHLRRHFEIISLNYLYDCMENSYKIDPSQILLTFDDGYKNNLNIVAPFLSAYNIPFAVFISTRHIHEGKRFATYYLRTAIFWTEQKSIDIPTLDANFDISTEKKKVHAQNIISERLKSEPQNVVALIVEDLIRSIPNDRWLEINSKFASDEPMNWSEVRQLHSLGVTIGSHCHDHAILHSRQSYTEIAGQLKTSKDLIEKNLGECKYFVYPNGEKDDIAFDALMSVKENEYLLGFTTVEGEIEKNSNRYLLPRISPPINLDHFKFSLNTCFRHNHNYKKWCLRFKDYS
jgi:peptidoglycan/xylan/chitin deacetylase (PgdA/CDA1 family)